MEFSHATPMIGTGGCICMHRQIRIAIARRHEDALTSLFQSMVAVTLLSELQNGQEKATSSFAFTFLGGGLDDFLLPMAHRSVGGQDSASSRGCLSSWRQSCKKLHPRRLQSWLLDVNSPPDDDQLRHSREKQPVWTSEAVQICSSCPA